LSLLLAGCAAPKSTAPAQKGDVELVQELAAARQSYLRGAWPQAVALYKLALKRAEAMDDATEIANTAFNYASALVQVGEYDTARLALREAKAEAATAGAPTADIIALEAHVARLQGKMDDAATLADSVLSDKSAAPADRLQVTLVKGQVACALKNAAGAKEAAGQARALIGTSTSPASAAGIAELDGCIALLDGKPAVAAERFDKQSTFLREGKLYGDMVRALARAGQAYADANQPAESAHRYFRAARSAMAQSGVNSGPALLEAASVQAEKSGDAGLIERVGQLRKTVPTTGPAR
jgi:ATP/maltotriose-dependent transcriptional regulator MalT